MGRIEEVRCTSWQGDAYSLLIKGHGRRVSVSVERVLEVDPWSETVLLAPSRRLRKQLSRSAGAVTKVSRSARVAAKGARRYAPVVLEGSRVATAVAESGSRRALRWSGPQARHASVVGRQAARLGASAIAATCVLVVSVIADALEWLWPRLRDAGSSARRSARRVLDRAVSRSASARRSA